LARNSARREPFGVAQIAGVLACQTEQVQGLGVAGRAQQGFATQRFRLFEVALLQHFPRPGEIRAFTHVLTLPAASR
jgi:hypothetical protein